MPNDFLFASDDLPAASPSPSSPSGPPHADTLTEPWQILVVDDEPEVHAVTRLALARMRFCGRGVRLLGAGSAAEAEQVLRATPDIAVILLDVVMETDDAGLRLVRTIRDALGNRAVRIILRTGQPGQAPEEDIVLDYDINDYKTKTELTAQKLFASVVTALRSYTDIRALESCRRGLERVIQAADRLFEPRSLAGFAVELLDQMPEVLDATPHALLCRGGAVIAGGGRYAPGEDAPSALPPAVPAAVLDEAARTGACRLESGGIALPIRGEEGETLVAWVELGRPAGDADRGLAELYASKIAVAYANLRLYERLHEVTETLEQRVAERTGALEESNARLKRLATLDPLTGVWNRRRFLELAEAELARARRYGRHLGLFLLDLDGFKRINDTHGHAVGDAVLRAVVKRARSVLRSSDHIARFGGEEFVVLLPETDGEGTVVVAERVRTALADSPVRVEGHAVAVTGSLGVASWLAEEPSIERTIHRADRALYAAKQAGRNRVERAPD